MSSASTKKVSSRNKLLDRLVGSIPAQYRQGMTRVAGRIHDSLPPAMIEHRLDALERHVDKRIAGIERQLEAILRRLEKR